jgi:hypothetical protein
MNTMNRPISDLNRAGEGAAATNIDASHVGRPPGGVKTSRNHGIHPTNHSRDNFENRVVLVGVNLLPGERRDP